MIENLAVSMIINDRNVRPVVILNYEKSDEPCCVRRYRAIGVVTTTARDDERQRNR